MSNEMLICPEPITSVAVEEWPPEVDLVLSALDAGRAAKADRRQLLRQEYRVKAWLRLFSDGADVAARPLFTRDLGPRSLGFISKQRLPLGYGGMIELPDPDGQLVAIHGTVLRCRPTAHGWFEGAFSFNREQVGLAESL